MARSKKLNGRFCLACGRPLYGNQQKWCKGNDDCQGWTSLHPTISIPCERCGEIIEIRKDYDKPMHNYLCVIEGTCSRCGKKFPSKGWWDHKKPIAWSCKECGFPPSRMYYGYGSDKDGNTTIFAPSNDDEIEDDLTITFDANQIIEDFIEAKSEELGITKDELIERMEKNAQEQLEKTEKKSSEWKY